MTHREFFEQVVAEIKRLDSPFMRRLFNSYTFDDTYPTQILDRGYITIDALDKADVPHSIEDNSIRLVFKIDFSANAISLHQSGHIWLSPADKAPTSPLRYYAMISMIDVAVRAGGKKFRKCKICKTPQEVARKLVTYFNDVMTHTNNYTNGYPYKQGA